MSDKTMSWKQHATRSECPVCKAKEGVWCYVKPGEHLLDDAGKPAGFHAARMARSMALENSTTHPK